MVLVVISGVLMWIVVVDGAGSVFCGACSYGLMVVVVVLVCAGGLSAFFCGGYDCGCSGDGDRCGCLWR